jgi:hypothetical protein
MTKKQIMKHLLDYHIGDLDHFLAQGGYPVRLSEERRELIKLCSWLHVNEAGLVARNEKEKIPSSLLAAYWKFRFDEADRDYNRLANAIEELYRKV